MTLFLSKIKGAKDGKQPKISEVFKETRKKKKGGNLDDNAATKYVSLALYFMNVIPFNLDVIIRLDLACITCECEKKLDQN